MMMKHCRHVYAMCQTIVLCLFVTSSTVTEAFLTTSKVVVHSTQFLQGNNGWHGDRHDTVQHGRHLGSSQNSNNNAEVEALLAAAAKAREEANRLSEVRWHICIKNCFVLHILR
jgi:hypothetical protein